MSLATGMCTFLTTLQAESCSLRLPKKQSGFPSNASQHHSIRHGISKRCNSKFGMPTNIPPPLNAHATQALCMLSASDMREGASRIWKLVLQPSPLMFCHGSMKDPHVGPFSCCCSWQNTHDEHRPYILIYMSISSSKTGCVFRQVASCTRCRVVPGVLFKQMRKTELVSK